MTNLEHLNQFPERHLPAYSTHVNNIRMYANNPQCVLAYLHGWLGVLIESTDRKSAKDLAENISELHRAIDAVYSEQSKHKG